MLTREWPPNIYGGAGVHVEHLVTHLQHHIEVSVRCFGNSRTGATGFEPPAELATADAALRVLGTDLMMAQAPVAADVVHSHTWYTNLAGHLTGLLHTIPHVVTAHSLEPLRPWKAEQLGSGYQVSSWIESSTYRTAQRIIAVSNAMREDLLSCYPFVDPDLVDVVHNGIDPDRFRPDTGTAALEKYRIEQPYVIFVGRITRQKGISHLLKAMARLDSPAQLVLCASSPETPEIATQTAAGVEELRRVRGENAVRWIEEPVPQPELLQLLTHASVFACPSIYEPLGIVNLEAMACETAVVASAVGGIPEVVRDGETGILVPYDAAEPAAFEVAFADALETLLAQPQLCRTMGAAGRARVIAHFTWDHIADQTIAVYRSVLDA
jgi:starch synthase